MNALTLQWTDAGQNKSQQIYEQQPSKNPGSVRIGRDPNQCDIVLTDRTVSGLHVEIFFNSQQQSFYIKNLRGESNPPLVDGQQLIQGETPINQGSIIYLGQVPLQVTAVNINTIPPTIISSPPQPQPAVHQHRQVTQPVKQQPVAPTPVNYGLQCSKCYKVSPVDPTRVCCPWCGTSLSGAFSVLVARG